MAASFFRILALAALGASLAGVPAAAQAPTGAVKPPALRVMTYNLRFNNPGDGPNAWPNRKHMVAALIRLHLVDVLGVQEALIDQLKDLEQALPDYEWVGVGREDGREKGEFSAILYRRDRLRLLESGTFWLSPTPEVVGSRGWDAALPRIVTWARFRDRATGKTLHHLNTHFDHRGEQARQESARLLLQRAGQAAESAPVIVTGDFNANETSEPYRILSADPLWDARLVSRNQPYGSSTTFNGFRAPSSGGRIDHIFVSRRVEVLQHATPTDSWDGRYPSDHFPVLAEVILR